MLNLLVYNKKNIELAEVKSTVFWRAGWSLSRAGGINIWDFIQKCMKFSSNWILWVLKNLQTFILWKFVNLILQNFTKLQNKNVVQFRGILFWVHRAQKYFTSKRKTKSKCFTYTAKQAKCHTFAQQCYKLVEYLKRDHAVMAL